MASQIKNPAPAIVHKLVETFEQNLDSYRSTKNETELRREFLDKFFTALGWDVSNEKAYDEAGKEVVHEFSVEISGQQKKADYAFRVGRGDKFDFLVEAKKPSVKIEASQDAAFQIRRYGWSAKLPINILTDFEHFAVYDCRAKPSYEDKASFGRILLIHYKEYVERWDEIASIFSPEAVRQGSFAKYAEGIKGKKGTADVDDAFLQEIERWRELLAKNIALRNEEIDIAGLNYAVQMTIDRIVFLRICEERGIEAENQLLDIANSDDAYRELGELFKRADTKYNSGLFHFKKEKEQASRADDLTLELEIDDKVLKDIISNLYYPKSPYAFLYIPADILGQVYERFLGKVIRLTAGHQAKVEEKPEVRKAGGVYYTPTYIVDYIVKNTVGKLVEGEGRLTAKSTKSAKDLKNLSGLSALSGSKGLSPADVAKLKIVDPACGSGTFLLGAYQFLLDWHLNWYMNDDVEKWERSKAIWKVESGYRLTTAKKKEILLNNIHGVDIDAQAVEVTKLSLLLKVLENASGQMGLGMERVLPDLGNNIKCGNSLIGFDYFEGQLLPDEEERARVNPFDWKNEFKDVFATVGRGGFDVVIGNPPYVLLSPDSFDKSALDYLNQYDVAQYKTDLFHLFIQKGIDVVRTKGLLGFIIPNTWFTLQFTTKLREYVLSKTEIDELTIFGHKVFQEANVHTGLIFLQKEVPENAHTIKVKNFGKDFVPDNLLTDSSLEFKQTDWVQPPDFKFEIRQHGVKGELIARLISQFPVLENVARASLGCQAYNSSKHTSEQIKNRAFHSATKISDEYLPELAGSDVARYFYARRKGQWIKYGSWLHDYRSMDWLTGPRILIREISGKSPYSICACYIEDTYCNYKTILNVNPSDKTNFSMKYLLGILNSRLISSVYPNVSNKIVSETFPRLSVRDVKRLPIRPINFTDPAEKAQHDKMVSLVEGMLAAHKSLVAAQSPAEKERLERQIEVTDRAIDSLVYELYGLSAEEIKIVEGT